MRDLLDQLHILGLGTKLVIADQRRERRTAEDAEFFFIHLLEQSALIELCGSLQVSQEFILLHVEDLDLETLASLALIEQILQSAPASFQLLEIGMMKYFVELCRDQFVDLRNASVDRSLRIFRNGSRTLQDLLHKNLD